jgi:hypothetical protein
MPGAVRSHRASLTSAHRTYRLPGTAFRPFDGAVPHAFVADRAVAPLGPAEPVGDLLRRHAEAGIELRVLDNVGPWWDRVITTSLGYSGIRLANARPRDVFR